MAPETQTLFKDIIFNLQAYLNWLHQWENSHEWTANRNANSHRQRLEELLPDALSFLRENDFDDLCG